MSRPLRLVVMMVRPPAALALLMFAALGMAQAGWEGGIEARFGLVLLTVVAWFVNATTVNDLADEAIDRVNLADARGRPLVSGEATRAHLARLAAAAGGAALVLAGLLGWEVVAVVAVGLVLNLAYSVPPVRISDRGVVAAALLPAGYVAVPYLVGSLATGSHLTGRALVLLAGLYVSFIGRILLKDFRDVEGDARYGKRTFLVRHGRAATCELSAACWVAGGLMLLAFVPPVSMLALAFAAYLGCAAHGLRALSVERGYHADQVTIGAVAAVGRGMVVTLLAHFTMEAQGRPAGAAAAIVAVLGLAFVAKYVVTLADRHAPVSIRPY